MRIMRRNTAWSCSVDFESIEESRAMSIAGGSHEIQKDILAKRALGL